jgi:hypothetical protein
MQICGEKLISNLEIVFVARQICGEKLISNLEIVFVAMQICGEKLISNLKIRINDCTVITHYFYCRNGYIKCTVFFFFQKLKYI